MMEDDSTRAGALRGPFLLGGDRVSEEFSILERLKGLETEQKNVQKSLDDMKGSMKEMTDTFTRFMTQQATVDARLLAIEQDLRDGRQHFKAHDEAIASMNKRCDQNQGQRDATKKHLDKAEEQEKKVQGAVLTAGWAERSVWLLITGVLGILLYLATRGAAGGP